MWSVNRDQCYRALMQRQRGLATKEHESKSQDTLFLLRSNPFFVSFSGFRG